MSPEYVDGGSACISSHVQVVSCSTSPWIVKVHVAVAILGVTSAASTGHCFPVSYCPGGRRGSRSALPRPVKPRVNFGIPARPLCGSVGDAQHVPTSHSRSPAQHGGSYHPRFGVLALLVAMRRRASTGRMVCG